MAPAKSGKSEFPKHWSEEQIMHNVSDLATDPTARIEYTKGAPGSSFTKAGDPSRYVAYGTRDGQPMAAVVEPAGEGIISGYPIHQLR